MSGLFYAIILAGHIKLIRLSMYEVPPSRISCQSPDRTNSLYHYIPNIVFPISRLPTQNTPMLPHLCFSPFQTPVLLISVRVQAPSCCSLQISHQISHEYSRHRSRSGQLSSTLARRINQNAFLPCRCRT